MNMEGQEMDLPQNLDIGRGDHVPAGDPGDEWPFIAWGIRSTEFP